MGQYMWLSELKFGHLTVSEEIFVKLIFIMVTEASENTQCLNIQVLAKFTISSMTTLQPSTQINAKWMNI